MIRTFCKLVIGLTLTGCTVNNFHPDSFSVAYKISHRENTFVELEKQVVPVPVAPAVVPVVTVTGNTHIRPECGPYVPLVMPEPARIDFTKLEAAHSSVEINALILENVKAMRKQMISFASQQQKHYATYVQRCVVK
jgi:hypothetical protein